MSSADRDAPYPPAAASVYTVHAAGEQQGCTNYGFRLSRPQDPPPSYEDVVSGNQWNLLNRHETSTTPTLSTQTESEAPRQEDVKEKCHTSAVALLCALLLTVIFIWRVSMM